VISGGSKSREKVLAVFSDCLSLFKGLLLAMVEVRYP
jgi:hypothetical protein